MNLEDYFDFFAEDDIRIRGTRVGIETVLYDYIHRQETAEQIAGRYRTLSLDQVYATILYYLSHRERIDAYLAHWLSLSHKRWMDQQREDAPHLRALREAKARYQAREP